jgi:hypothetical protein
MQRLLAIAWLTWKAALRFRLFLVIAALLLAAVVGLPILIKDDGTASGFTQILLTYTLGAITGLLGLSTLWLACGTLARDIEECQMQMLAVKPIARWQIWLGKWLGIMSLNAALLLLSGGAVYGLLQWRATKLPAAEQAKLRSEVLVARGSAKEKSWNQEIDAATEATLEKRLKNTPVAAAEMLQVRQQIREQVKTAWQIVQPGQVRVWQIDLGAAAASLRDVPLQLRVKFNAAESRAGSTFTALWQVGTPETPQVTRLEPMSLAPDTFHEFAIPANLPDAKGVLTIVFANPNSTTLLFPLEDGMEVLYRTGGFGGNFMRGLGIIFCWMGLLAAIGLAAASQLSFPVAAFFSLAVLIVGLSGGTLTTAVENGTVAGVDEENGIAGRSLIDGVALPAFKGALVIINLVKGFSPIDSLSTGRSITWGELGRAFAQIVLLLGGFFAVVGMTLLRRRELATAQGTQ